MPFPRSLAPFLALLLLPQATAETWALKKQVQSGAEEQPTADHEAPLLEKLNQLAATGRLLSFPDCFNLTLLVAETGRVKALYLRPRVSEAAKIPLEAELVGWRLPHWNRRDSQVLSLDLIRQA